MRGLPSLEKHNVLLAVRGWFHGVAGVVGARWAAIKKEIDVDALISRLDTFDLWRTGKNWIGSLWRGAIEQWQSLTAWFERKVSELTGFIPDWLKETFGIRTTAPDAQGAGATPATIIPPALGAGAQETRVGGEVRIRFENAPPGTRITAIRSDNPNVPLDVTAGIVLPGVY